MAGTDPRDGIAASFEAVASQLEAAAAHARTAAEHFRQRRVPPGCAHKVSIDGHLVTARRLLDGIAEAHAGHSEP